MARLRSSNPLRSAPGLGARTIAPIRVAFRQRNDVGARDEGTFAAQWLAYALPCQRFADALAGICAGRCGSLLLHRDGLAPSTPCRSPGASGLPPSTDIIGVRRHVANVPTTNSCTQPNPIQSSASSEGLAALIGDVHLRRRTAGKPAHAAHPVNGRPRRGSRTVNSVKSPTWLSTVIVPPCCSVTIS